MQPCPQFPKLPDNSLWIIVAFSHRDSAGRRYWLVRCSCNPAGRAYQRQEGHLRSSASLSCGCHRAAVNYGWTKCSERLSETNTSPYVADSALDRGAKNSGPNQSNIMGARSSPPNSSPRHKFSKTFLKNLVGINVADLARLDENGDPTCFKQSPPVEKILKAEGLELGVGMAPRDDDGVRGDNLILVGNGPDIDQAIKNDKADRRVGPSGVNPHLYSELKNGGPKIITHLKFGRGYNKPKIIKLLCPEHGRQAVVKQAGQKFILSCGCTRTREIK
jgi:hypothetical protein